MEKVAIVIGHRGQDGTLLSKSLKYQGFKVIGVSRGTICQENKTRSDRHGTFSLLDKDQVLRLIDEVRPSEVYYLAAHHASSEQNDNHSDLTDYEHYHNVHVVGLINFLDAIKKCSRKSRLFYAGSSLVYSGTDGPFQNEETPFSPLGFYGLTKAQGLQICKSYRVQHGVFASGGILYNHESSLRRQNFLSKRLILSTHSIYLGHQNELLIGNLSSETDWGYAPDYVEAFQRILRLESPDDFIVSSGESHSVGEFVKIVFDCFKLNYRDFVIEDSSLLHRSLPRKVGNNRKLIELTGWNKSLDFPEMVRTLVRDYLDSIGQSGLASKLAL